MAAALPAMRRNRRPGPRFVPRLRRRAAVEPQRLPALRPAPAGSRRGLRRLPAAPAAGGPEPCGAGLWLSGRPAAAAAKVPCRSGLRPAVVATDDRRLRRIAAGPSADPAAVAPGAPAQPRL